MELGAAQTLRANKQGELGVVYGDPQAAAPFIPVVEDRDPGLLPQHAGAAHRLQDGPADRPEHPDGALAPKAGAHLLRAGGGLGGFGPSTGLWGCGVGVGLGLTALLASRVVRRPDSWEPRATWNVQPSPPRRACTASSGPCPASV